MAGLVGHGFSKEWQDIDWASMSRTGAVRRVPPSHLPVQPTYTPLSNSKSPQPVYDAANDDIDEEYRAAVQRYVELAVSLATLITENLLSHPFVVLRRQCQVQPGSRRWHMTPFTLVPVVVRLHQRQGVATLWKGLGSCLLVRGLVLAAEDSLSKFTPWPNISLAIVTPFYSASLVETVQSDIASEKPGLLDVFKEGLCRVVSVGAARGRMLPVWSLIPITVSHGLLKYLVSLGVRHAAAWTIHMQIRAQQVRRGALNKDVDSEENQQRVDVTAAFIGMLTAEVVCYPVETILHRLHLQGTRTIVDQLDNGTEVIPILTAYRGVGDCYSDAVATEGVGGLYRGFGALIVQLAVHWAVIRLTRSVVAWAVSILRPAPPPRRVLPTVTEEPKPFGSRPVWQPLNPLQIPNTGVSGGWTAPKMKTPVDAWQPPLVTSTPVSTPVNPYMSYRRRDSE